MEGRGYLIDVHVDGSVILNWSLVNKECSPACSCDLVRTRC